MKTLLEFLQKRHIENIDAESDFKFSCKGKNKVMFKVHGIQPTLYYKLSNMETYVKWDCKPIEFGNNIDIYIKGDNPKGLSEGPNDYGYFIFSNKVPVECYGNIMKLLGENVKDIPSNYCFYSLFNECHYLTTAPELPATNLKPYCYYKMFDECASLLKAPDLPATNLAEGCYEEMFNTCETITKTPDLPAKNLENLCYYGMFAGCYSLNEICDLPATKIKYMSYELTFAYCVSLSKMPKIAAKLSDDDLKNMFKGCPKITF